MRNKQYYEHTCKRIRRTLDRADNETLTHQEALMFIFARLTFIKKLGLKKKLRRVIDEITD